MGQIWYNHPKSVHYTKFSNSGWQKWQKINILFRLRFGTRRDVMGQKSSKCIFINDFWQKTCIYQKKVVTLYANMQR